LPQPTGAVRSDACDFEGGATTEGCLPLDFGRLCIEPLNDLHCRGAFRCTDIPIQNFCRGRLVEHNRRDMMRAYVARYNDSLDVLGFYYLLNTSIEREKLGPRGGAAEFIDVDRIPAIYLGMIGVHAPLMRQGLGSELMLHAFRRVVEVSTNSGVWAMTLDAASDEAADYYERFSFKRFDPAQREMYLPLGTIKRALERLEDTD
jgi:GNAT superfamily N-acetyltransferase